MINVGDKFVVELEKVFEQDGEKLYRAKGFKSLVFDDNGLKKLVPLEEAANVNMEAARYAGRAEVWELVKFLKETDELEVRKIFNVPVIAYSAVAWILEQNVHDVLDKYHEWKKKSKEIMIGDVVINKYGYKGVVTRKGDTWLEGLTIEGIKFSCQKDNCTKTGKHIDIESILQQIEDV